MQANTPEGLTRAIGVRKLTISVVNLTIGAGIFAMPAVVAGHLGEAGVLAYLICGFLLALVLLCFVEIGSGISTTGGVYEYVGLAFGPYAGFLTNMLFAGFALSADAAVANVLIDNLSLILPVAKLPVVRFILMVFIFGSIGWMNVLGLKQGLKLVMLFTLAKLIPLVILVVLGSFYIEPANLVWKETPSPQSLSETALILFFAFGGGAEATLNATGEIRDPARTIPRGILLGALAVFIIYVAVHVVAQGVLGSQLPLTGEAPLAAVANKFAGSYGTWLMLVGAIVSCFGLIGGDILASSRLPYAAARDGLLPAFIAEIHPRFVTPYWSVIVYAGIGFILAVSGGFRQLAILSSVAILLVYVGVILATIKLRQSRKSGGGFRLPGGITVPVMALLVTGWFLTSLTKQEVIASAIFIALFSGIYLGYKYFRRSF
jgi:basic amino acid/polyamine antiporter, APA family